MKKTVAFGVILIMILACVGAASANLVQNPSFESPKVTGDFTTCPGDTCPDSWTVGVGTNINFIGTYWTSSDGSQSIDMSGQDSRGSLSQQIPTATNGPYKLTFDMSGNFVCGPQNFRNISVYWDGNLIGSESFVKPGTWSQTDMGWTQKSLHLPAPAGITTELKFADISAGVDNCGVALDNVAVIPEQSIPTPEFPTIALPVTLIIGMLGAILFIQRTKE